MTNLRMRTKLSLGFGVVLLLMLVLGGVMFEQLRVISQSATFTSAVLIPQTSIAINLDERVRDMGLNIRAFADSGAPKRWEQVVTSIQKFKLALTDLSNLTHKQTDLHMSSAFLKNVEGPFQHFEKVANDIKVSRDSVSTAITTMQNIGPLTVGTVNQLIEYTLADLRAERQSPDESRVNRIFHYLDRFSALFDVVADQRRDIFLALATHDITLLHSVVAKFAEPLAEIDRLSKELAPNESIVALLKTAKQALTDYSKAAAAVKQAVDAVETIDATLVDVHELMLKLVADLTHKTQERAAIIAEETTLSTLNSIKYMVVLLTMGILLGLGMTILLTLSITRPLSHFVQAATRLSIGEFETRVEIHSTDELGVTAANINRAFDVVVDKMRWYESMLDAIPSIISVTDLERRWTFLNRAAENALNTQRTRLIGHPCHEFGAPSCKTADCGLNCLERGQKESSTVINGRTFSILPSHITNSHGDAVGHIELCTDITELQQMREKAEFALSQGMQTAAARIEKVVDVMSKAVVSLTEQVEDAEHGSVEQAARMSETATAMEEMNCTVSEVARNADSAAQVSAATRKQAESGARVVSRVVNSIQIVQRDSEQLKADMTALDVHAQAITRIMSVISDIADQTNLLALNAAIEAARAGEAGRGFAVVADEVRKLAEKTMTSTLDVRQAILAIQQSATKSSQQVDIAVRAIEEATVLAEESGKALAEIVHMVDSAADQVRAIATASEQQSASSEEINRTVTQVNTIATDTARTMQEAARSVSDLSGQSSVLSKLVLEMKNS